MDGIGSTQFGTLTGYGFYASGSAYLEGSIIKYIHRYKYKNSNIEDLKKASWYLDFLIKHYEEL